MYLYANKEGKKQLPKLCNTVSGYLGARMQYFTIVVIDLRKEYAKKEKLQGNRRV